MRLGVDPNQRAIHVAVSIRAPHPRLTPRGPRRRLARMRASLIPRIRGRSPASTTRLRAQTRVPSGRAADGATLAITAAAQSRRRPMARRARRRRARILLRRMPRRRATRSCRGARRRSTPRARRPRTARASTRGRRRTTSGRTGTMPRRRPDWCARRPAGRAEVSLLLEGIHCGACIWLIESWLARQRGRGRGERQLRHPARARRLGSRASEAVRPPARGRPRSAIARIRTTRRGARRSRARESRALLLRMAVALLAMMQVMMFALPTYITVDGVEPKHRLLLEWASLTLTLPAILYSAAPFFRGAWRDLRHLRPGMDVPVALGLGAAFIASAWSTFRGDGAVYYDSVTMFIALLLLARYVEFVARRRAGDAVEGVAKARPGHGIARRRMAVEPRGRDGRRGAARRERHRAGAPRGHRSRRRRNHRRPCQRRGGGAHRRIAAARPRGRRPGARRAASCATARWSCASPRRAGRRAWRRSSGSSIARRATGRASRGWRTASPRGLSPRCSCWPP